MAVIPVALAGRAYDVHVARGLLERIGELARDRPIVAVCRPPAERWRGAATARAPARSRLGTTASWGRCAMRASSAALSITARPGSAQPLHTARARVRRRRRCPHPNMPTIPASSRCSWTATCSAVRSGPAAAQRIIAGCVERGVLVLPCGPYGNVIRILCPLVITDEQLDRALDVLETEVLRACPVPAEASA